MVKVAVLLEYHERPGPLILVYIVTKVSLSSLLPAATKKLTMDYKMQSNDDDRLFLATTFLGEILLLLKHQY